MPTPISSATPYATAAQLLTRFDVRVVADLCSDDDAESPLPAQLKDATTTAGAKLYAALQDASGDVEAACFVGERYTAADLVALTGNGAATLMRLVTTLALDYLYQRRCDPGYQASIEVQKAQRFLGALADGERIFGLQEQAGAGLLSIETEAAATVAARDLVTLQANRFFGTRANRRTG